MEKIKASNRFFQASNLLALELSCLNFIASL